MKFRRAERFKVAAFKVPKGPVEIETKPLYDERGNFIGRVDVKTGTLYSQAGNISSVHSKKHAARRAAAESLGVIFSVNTRQWEEEQAEGE